MRRQEDDGSVASAAVKTGNGGGMSPYRRQNCWRQRLLIGFLPLFAKGRTSLLGGPASAATQ